MTKLAHAIVCVAMKGIDYKDQPIAFSLLADRTGLDRGAMGASNVITYTLVFSESLKKFVECSEEIFCPTNDVGNDKMKDNTYDLQFTTM